jgi:hypothetical protein
MNGLPIWIGTALGALTAVYGYLNTSGALTQLSPSAAGIVTAIGGLITVAFRALQSQQVHTAVTNVQAVQAVTHPAAVAQVAADTASATSSSTASSTPVPPTLAKGA